MDEHEPGAERDGAVDQLALGGDAGDDLGDRLAAGHLEPVGPEVAERTGIKQIVERCESAPERSPVRFRMARLWRSFPLSVVFGWLVAGRIRQAFNS